MCGIVGVVTSAAAPVDDALVARALARMARRGPDAEGRWSEPGIALGHRRLAIVDLDARSHQPLHSACGRYAISYNGEIYNYRQLRHELAASGVALRTTAVCGVCGGFARSTRAIRLSTGAFSGARKGLG